MLLQIANVHSTVHSVTIGRIYAQRNKNTNMHSASNPIYTGAGGLKVRRLSEQVGFETSFRGAYRRQCLSSSLFTPDAVRCVACAAPRGTATHRIRFEERSVGSELRVSDRRCPQSDVPWIKTRVIDDCRG